MQKLKCLLQQFLQVGEKAVLYYTFIQPNLSEQTIKQINSNREGLILFIVVTFRV